MTDKKIESLDENLEGQNLSQGDKDLIKGAVTGEGLVELTPGLVDQIGQSIQGMSDWTTDEAPGIWAALSDDQKLAAACYIIPRIHEHMLDGGSFRYLIYERLGFGPEAYGPIYMSNGMDVSNLCPVANNTVMLAKIKEALNELPHGHTIEDEIADIYTMIDKLV